MINPFDTSTREGPKRSWTMEKVDEVNGFFIYKHSIFGYTALCPVRWAVSRTWFKDLEEAVIDAIQREPYDYAQERRRY